MIPNVNRSIPKNRRLHSHVQQPPERPIHFAQGKGTSIADFESSGRLGLHNQGACNTQFRWTGFHQSGAQNLEDHGYVVRRQLYDKRGRFAKCEYTVYERPQRSSPPTGSPLSEKPTTDNPSPWNASTVKPTLLNTNEEITEESNTDSMNYPSINLDRMDGTDERSEYEELIKENIGFDYLIRNYHYDRDRLQEIVDIILDVVCSCAETIRINGEDIPVAVIKSRYLKLNDSHIEYVIDSMAKNPSDIRNIRAYLLTALYNAPVTIDNYYSALVNHDLYGQDKSSQ